ncbi:MAG: hypothetical protein BM562_01040 [Alphaproteobacteria bacterium MedPE-SWcel]|nr:MAG: hypothetical protein BM562_01040 [Alphaproteobacteria bacterium MedPE-SWcel]
MQVYREQAVLTVDHPALLTLDNPADRRMAAALLRKAADKTGAMDVAPARRLAMVQTLAMASVCPAFGTILFLAAKRRRTLFQANAAMEVRGATRTRDLPEVLLTGEGDIPMAVKAISQGAFDFLEKPCASGLLSTRGI